MPRQLRKDPVLVFRIRGLPSIRRRLRRHCLVVETAVFTTDFTSFPLALVSC